MKGRARGILSALGIVAGVALVAFELTHFSTSGPVERWFWLLVGALLAALGAAHFLSNGRRHDRQ